MMTKKWILLLVTLILCVSTYALTEQDTIRSKKPLLQRLKNGVHRVISKAKSKNKLASKNPSKLKTVQKLAKTANKMVTKVLSQAAAKAQNIINKAKVAKCSKCKKKKKKKGKSPEELRREKGKYLEVTMPDHNKRDYKKLGVHNKLNIHPRVLHHAKWLNYALRNAHRNFVKVHEKNCKGPICPLGNGGIVPAHAIPGGAKP